MLALELCWETAQMLLWDPGRRGPLGRNLCFSIDYHGLQAGQNTTLCFLSPSKDITVVVHGDDFSAMGLKHNLDWYESKLAEHFEIGGKTRMGTEEGDAKEVRILNRILRLTEHGLMYEADPRHVELLARSPNLSNANSRVTPGNKPRLVEEPDAQDPADELPPDADQQPPPQTIYHIRPRPQIKEALIDGCTRKIRQHLQFNDEPQIKTLHTPYSIVYGHHPSTVFFTERVGDK